MPRKDFIPDGALPLRDWTANYLLEIDPIATRISWPIANTTALKTRLTTIKNAAQAVIDAQNALDTATGQLELAKETELPEIRKDTNNLKSTRGFTEGDARTLDVLTTGGGLDPDTYQPQLDAKSMSGRIEITGKKLGADSLNLYARLKGQASWTLLAGKRARFPYYDERPPAVPGQPEEREYQAIGVVGDDEVGQPSDIVSAVFRP